MIAAHARRRLLERAALPSVQPRQRLGERMPGQFEVGGLSRLHPVEALGVFEQRRVAAAAHVGKNLPDDPFDRFVLRGLERGQPLELSEEIRLCRGEPAHVEYLKPAEPEPLP